MAGLTQRATILIVDDEPLNIQLLAAYLKDDYQIKVATSGEQALSLLTPKHDVDLVLLDIEMPQMNGYEVCQQLMHQNHTKFVPVIFITAQSQQSQEEYGFKVGAVDYITKPISQPIVKARVHTHVTLKRQRDTLETMALFDQLTRVRNRHYLFEVAEQKISESMRYGRSLALLLIDIDYFKKVNDQHGHDVGDLVLVQFASLLNNNARQEDVVARLGGEEFVLLLNQCDETSAEKKALSLCEKVAQADLAGLKLTASFGVSQLQQGDDVHRLIKRADDALYQAKEQGRNRVVLAS